MRIEIDSDLRLKHATKGADPYIFIPNVNVSETKEESIINIF